MLTLHEGLLPLFYGKVQKRPANSPMRSTVGIWHRRKMDDLFRQKSGVGPGSGPMALCLRKKGKNDLLEAGFYELAENCYGGCRFVGVCVACDRFEPREHVSEIEDIIRYKRAIGSLCDHYYIDTRILGTCSCVSINRLIVKPTGNEWSIFGCSRSKSISRKSEDQYLSILNGLMDQYRDTEIVLGPIKEELSKWVEFILYR